jgi:vacuolar-type H+-ATPase subunit E/Vma4
MSTTPTLVELIRGEGAAEAQRLLAAARSEAARLRAVAEAEANAAVRLRVEARRRELAAGYGQQLAAARQASRRLVFEALARVLWKVRDGAMAILPQALRRASAASLIDVLLDEAYQYVPPGGAKVRCSPGLARSVTAHLSGQDQVDVVEDPTILAGVRLECAGAGLTVDNTLETRLARTWPALSAEILVQLSPELPH